MSFTPKTIDQIIAQMIDYMRARSNLTDFNIGSVVRTILESSALEDDEIYFQMGELLRMFSFLQAEGSELDRRANDFDLTRLESNEAVGEVRIADPALQRTYINAAVTAGSLTIPVADDSVFSALAPPFTIRVGEGTGREEDVTVDAAWASGTNVIDLSPVTPLVNDHPGVAAVTDEWTEGASRVAYVSGAANQNINSGTGVSKPVTTTAGRVNFVTTADSTVANGDYMSDLTAVQSIAAGALTNAPARTLTEWTSAAPFAGAIVTNIQTLGGGRDLETDDEFRNRIIDHIASLIKATIQAVESASTGVEVVATGQTSVRSKVYEDLIAELVRVYIDDGSGSFVPDSDLYASDELALVAPFGAGVITVTGTTNFPAAGFVILQPGTVDQEILEYDTLLTAPPRVQFVAGVTVQLPAGHNIGDVVQVVEEVESSTELNEKFFELDNIAVIEGTMNLFHLPPGSTFPNSLALSADYFMNEGVGQVELINLVAATSGVYAFYQWYTGLIEEVQRVLDGDISDPATYPGVRAAGVKLVVEGVDTVNIDVFATLQVASGADKTDLIASAELAVTSYLSSLPIGSDVIRNEIIQRIMETSEDIIDMSMPIPAANVTVLENEVPHPRTITIS